MGPQLVPAIKTVHDPATGLLIATVSLDGARATTGAPTPGTTPWGRQPVYKAVHGKRAGTEYDPVSGSRRSRTRHGR
jgi:hypothetical protein